MAGTIIPNVPLTWDSGQAGMKLFCYAAGTTTKQATYTDSTITVPNANPIILDASGRAYIFLNALSYKFVLAPATDTDPPTSPIWTRDNVTATVSATQIATTINVFTVSGTWTKVTGASIVDVTLMGPGGAGGTGRRGAAGSLRGGGGGGHAGGYSIDRFAASILAATEQVIVGNGGVAVAGASADNTDGSPGNPGDAASRFGAWITAGVGGGGGAGTGAIGGAGGSGSAATQFSSGAGGTGSDGSATALDGTGGTFLTAGGGGGGGGISAGNVSRSGGAGGNGSPARFNVPNGGSGAVTGVSNATVGTSVLTNEMAGGGGGGGGAGTDHMNGFAGGTYGAGGGGGGASLNGTASGTSGAGAQGLVIVMQT